MFASIAKLMVFVVVPNAWQQGIFLMTALQESLNQCYHYAAILLKRYPALMDAGIIDMMAANTRGWLFGMSESVLKFLLAALVGLLTLVIYLNLVPMMMIFLLKDKAQMLNAVRRVLLRNRGLAGQVWLESNQQITNKIRSKVLKMAI